MHSESQPIFETEVPEGTFSPFYKGEIRIDSKNSSIAVKKISVKSHFFGIKKIDGGDFFPDDFQILEFWENTGIPFSAEIQKISDSEFKVIFEIFINEYIYSDYKEEVEFEISIKNYKIAIENDDFSIATKIISDSEFQMGTEDDLSNSKIIWCEKANWTVEWDQNFRNGFLIPISSELSIQSGTQ